MTMTAVRTPDATRVLRRTMDAARFTTIANHPAVRPSLGGEPGPLDLTGVIGNPLNVALESEHGGFIMVALEPGVYEVHSLFLPEGRGRESLAAMRDGLAYMFAQTDCHELVTRVPSDNQAAAGLAGRAGFTTRFTRRGVWPEPGGPSDVAYLGLTLPDWAQRAIETHDAGDWFHAHLEAAKAAAGSTLPVHADDEAHDRAAGAAVLMARAGNGAKAVFFYNRWARCAGYALITLLSDHPVVIDVVDAIVALHGDAMEVLTCR